MVRNRPVVEVPSVPALTDPSQNPFYVHPTESSTAALVSPPLNGKNYHSWSRLMKKAIIMKNKLRFIDGSSPMPDSFDPTFEVWIRCNNLVHSWLMNSVTPSIAQSLIYTDSAADAWNDLQARFSRADRVRISTLQRDLHSFRQNSLSVTEYFTELKSYWEELEVFRPIPNCTCNVRCSCEAMRNSRRFRDEDLILLFLTGLNDNYAIVRSQILLMEPFPNLNSVFGMILQHESLNGLDVTENLEVMVNLSDGKKPTVYGKGKGNSNTKPCSYCNRTGHTVDTCYRKHGYPPGFRFRDGSAPAKHLMAAVNCVDTDDTDTRSVSAHVDDSRPGAFFSIEEMQALKSILKNTVKGDDAEHAVNVVRHLGHSVQSAPKPHSDMTQGKTCVSCCSISGSIDAWILDSGATDHACCSLSMFSRYKRVPDIPVRLPNGNLVHTNIIGDIHVTYLITLTGVLYIPQFNYNLISISKVTQALDCNFVFTDSLCLIQSSVQKMIGSGRMVNGLYYLESTTSHGPSPVYMAGTHCNSVTIPKTALWHFRFGHTSCSRIEAMAKLYSDIVWNKDTASCDICHLSKQKKLPFNFSNHRASCCFELLHMDLWGPFSTATVHGHKYFLTIVDDFSRFTWLVLLKGKHEAMRQVKNFVAYVETQFNAKIKVLRSDNGPEFTLADFYASKGIVHQTSCVGTPQQNGRVERKHQCILNIARALLLQSYLPSKYWGFVVAHAVFIMNRVPSNAIQGEIPYKLAYNELPDLSSFKVFGSLCFATTQDCHKSKLDHRARKCVFLGFRQGMKGYVVLDLHTFTITVSRHVQFEETIFPYKSLSPSKSSWEYLTLPLTPHSNPPPPTPIASPPIDLPDTNNTPHSSPSSPLPNTNTTTEPTLPTSLRKSARPKRLPLHLMDYQCDEIVHKTPYPITNFVSHSNISPLQHKYTLSLLTEHEPTSYAEACQHDCWVKAMQLELDALALNHTWSIVDLPPHAKAIGSKWVYKIKRKSDGSIERYKARLVAKGYNQVEGVDYFETFSPVAKMSTIRVLLAVASINHWNIHQLDVNNAFLHGDLSEDVYMKIPQGLEGIPPHKVCKLDKSLYGLKQASRKWYENCLISLFQLGMHRLHLIPLCS